MDERVAARYRQRLTQLRDGRGSIELAECIFGVEQERVDLGATRLFALRLQCDLHGTIEGILLERLPQHPANQLARFVGVLLWSIEVRERLDVVDVEWNRRVALAEDGGPRLARRVADANLVHDVRIQAGDVGQHEPRAVQVLEHLLSDITREEVLVGPRGLQLAALGQRDRVDGRLEDILVNVVEVDLVLADGLAAERHHHKTDLCVVHKRPWRRRADVTIDGREGVIPRGCFARISPLSESGSCYARRAREGLE